MSSDPYEVVKAALAEATGDTLEWWADEAKAIVDALTLAGLLLPPGTETEIAWASHDGALRWGVGSAGEAAAKTEVAHGKGALMSRQEHSEPWREVTS